MAAINARAELFSICVELKSAALEYNGTRTWWWLVEDACEGGACIGHEAFEGVRGTSDEKTCHDEGGHVCRHPMCAQMVMIIGPPSVRVHRERGDTGNANDK